MDKEFAAMLAAVGGYTHPLIPLGTSLLPGRVHCCFVPSSPYSTGSVSEVERHACLMLLTCLDCVYFLISPWCLHFCCGWVGSVLKSISYLSVLGVFISIISVYCYAAQPHVGTGCVILKIDQTHSAFPTVWLPVWLDLLCGDDVVVVHLHRKKTWFTFSVEQSRKLLVGRCWNVPWCSRWKHKHCLELTVLQL